MSNPTTKVAQFNGSLDGFTGTGPERYSNGLWLEEATSNSITNPSFETNTTGWLSVGSAVLTQITSDHYSGAAACQVVTNGSGTQGAVLAVSGPAQGQTWTNTFRIKGAAGTTVRVMIRDTVSAVQGAFTSQNVVLDGEDNGWDVIPFTRTLTDVGANGCHARFDVSSVSGTFIIDAVQLEQKDHATSYTDSIRAASSASVTSAEPVSVACWYREGYSGAKQFAYLDTLGQLGDYGDVSWAAGDLTISTSRNLVIGPFAAFDRALTAGEQANLRSTQNWTMNSVNGSNIILPLSGARRRRR